MHLNTHSYYSFKYGSISPEDLLKDAQQKGIFTLALTDINSTAGCLEFVRESPKYGIRPVLGVDFRNGTEQLFVAIAKNNQGFLEINTYLSQFLSGSHSETAEGSKEVVLKGLKQIPFRAPEV